MVMNTPAVPQDGQRTAQLGFEPPQILHNVFAMHVSVVRQQIEIQIQAAVLGADRNAANRRDAVAAIPGVHGGGVAARRPGSTKRGGQHKAGFVEKNQVGVAQLSLVGDARNTRVCQSIIAASLRLRARRVGFCTDQPSR